MMDKDGCMNLEGLVMLVLSKYARSAASEIAANTGMKHGVR
jgi:hypothetical protein